jgi:hypothetical protein
MKIDFSLADIDEKDGMVFEIIKCCCKGMMSPNLYRKIFYLCKSLGSGIVLELGTAGGASIISAGLGLKAANKGLKAISLDKFSGGSWGECVDADLNLQTVRDRMLTFGVSEHVDILMERLDGARKLYSQLELVSFLIIDADGRIHRDLMNLSNSCVSETLVLIDDCEKYVRVNSHRKGYWTICWKKFKTWIMVKHLINNNILIEREIVDGAFFGNFYPKKMNLEIFNELNVIYSNIEKMVISLEQVRVNLNSHDQFNELYQLLYRREYEEFFFGVGNNLKGGSNLFRIEYQGHPFIKWI